VRWQNLIIRSGSPDDQNTADMAAEQLITTTSTEFWRNSLRPCDCHQIGTNQLWQLRISLIEHTKCQSSHQLHVGQSSNARNIKCCYSLSTHHTVSICVIDKRFYWYSNCILYCLL